MHKPKETSKNQARMGNTDGMIMDVVSPVFNKNPKRQKNSSEKRGFSELFCLQSEVGMCFIHIPTSILFNCKFLFNTGFG